MQPQPQTSPVTAPRVDESAVTATSEPAAVYPRQAPEATAGTPAETSAPSAELVAQIACRAYELYEQRGCEDGHDLDDWLTAENEILGNKT